MTISGHDDQWGEPDPLIDFSVEEILDMPTVSEVQPDPTPKVTDCDLQSEGDKPKMDNETVSQDSSKRNDFCLSKVFTSNTHKGYGKFATSIKGGGF